MTLLLIVTACSSARPTENIPSNELFLIPEADSLAMWATEADRQTAQDILTAMQANSEQVCADLQTACEFPIRIEIYPDQASFDTHVMNQEMRGFFAISGDRHIIQMVSPANPWPHKISYQDGILVAVHEFAHLALDEVNPEIPTWLDEGTAVYVGPHKTYTTVCQIAFPFEMMPPFRQLEADYNSIPAPDLFAYTAVDFIVSEYGIEKLRKLLRSPEDLERVLGVSRAVFEEEWQRFMRAQYHNYKAQAIPALGIVCVTLLALGGIMIGKVVRRRRKETGSC